MFKKLKENRKRKKELNEELNTVRRKLSETIALNNNSIEGISIDLDEIWKHGFDEGYIQGYQEAIFNMIDQFLNSDLAKENHISKISAELSDTKRKSKDKIKSNNYTNMTWF